MTRAGMNYNIKLEGKNGLGNVRLDGAALGGLEILLDKRFQKKLSAGDKRTLDVLWNLLDVNPKTKKVTAKSMYQVTAPANQMLGELLSRTAATLKAGRNLMPGSVLESGTKNIGIRGTGYGPKQVSPVWNALSWNYLKKIGLAYEVASDGPQKAFRPTAGIANKKFWYERARAGAPTDPEQTGPPMVLMAAKYFDSLAAQVLKGKSKKGNYEELVVSKSGAGKPNRFTIANLERRGRPTFYGGGNQYAPARALYGISGNFVFPSKFSAPSNPRLDEAFTLTLIRSLAKGKPALVEDYLNGKEIINDLGNPDKQWPARLLLNELSRPWISYVFSREGGTKFTNHLRRIVAQTSGAKVAPKKGPKKRLSRSQARTAAARRIGGDFSGR